jgi:hypothetical protein
VITGSPKDIAPAAVVRDGLSFNFDPKIAHNRAGLTMTGASVVVARAGLDADHGWVMSFDADTLQRTGIFCATCARAAPTSRPLDCADPGVKPWLIGGGIWQSGRPPVVDAQGHVYAFTGNGWTHGCSGKTQWYANACEIGQPKPAGYYGESLVRLDPRNGLAASSGRGRRAIGARWSWAMPTSAAPGPALFDFAPAGSATRTFAVGGGKEGRLYAIDTSAVAQPDGVEGLYVRALHGDFHVVRDVPSASCAASTPAQRAQGHHIMGGPVIWPRSRAGAVSVFVSEESDCVRGFTIASTQTQLSQLTALIRPNPVTATKQVIEGHPGVDL